MAQLVFWVSGMVAIATAVMLLPMSMADRAVVAAVYVVAMGAGRVMPAIKGKASRLAGLGILALVAMPLTSWWSWVALATVALLGYASATYVAMSRVVPATGLLIIVGTNRSGELADGGWLTLWLVAVLLNLLVMSRITPTDSVQGLTSEWGRRANLVPQLGQPKMSLVLLAMSWIIIVPSAIWSAGIIQETTGLGWIESQRSGVDKQGGPAGQMGFLGGLDTGSPVSLSDEVVLKVESEQPLYWRALAYSEWDGRHWANTASMPVTLGRSSALDLSRYTGRSGADAIADDVPSRNITQKFTAVQAAVDVLPAAWLPNRVHGLSNGFSWGSDGSLALSAPLGAGASWTVESQVVDATGDLLRAHDPLGPQRNQVVLDEYAQQNNIDPEVAELALEITSQAPTTYDKLIALEKWFDDNLIYSRSIDRLEPGVDSVSHLLFVSRKGFCEQIGSAMVVMARSLGIPARLAVGYVPSEFDEATGQWISRGTDAHAWAEVWFPGVGWQGFDPTAGVPLAGESSVLTTKPSLVRRWGLFGSGMLIPAGIGLWLYIRAQNQGSSDSVGASPRANVYVDRSTRRKVRSKQKRLNRCGKLMGLQWSDSTTLTAKGHELVSAGIDPVVVFPVIETLRSVLYRDLENCQISDVQLGWIDRSLSRLQDEVSSVRRQNRPRRGTRRRTNVTTDLTSSTS